MRISSSKLRTHFIPSENGVIGPILILAHGRLGSLRLLEWVTKRFKIPELSYLLIEAPFKDTPTSEDKRPERFGINVTQDTYSWYLDEFSGLEDSRKYLNDLIDEIHSQGINYKSIYWLGFSQGGMMGLDLFLRSDQRLGGLISVSGICLDVESYPERLGGAGKDQNILITHGTRDENILFEDADASYKKLQDAGVSFKFETFDKPHSFQLNKEVPLLEDTLRAWIAHGK